MQTIGEYLLALVICAASGAIAIGLAAIFGGSVLEYLVGMVLFRVCLWEAWGLIAANRKERKA
jgi:hypothetical protein